MGIMQLLLYWAVRARRASGWAARNRASSDGIGTPDPNPNEFSRLVFLIEFS